MKTQRRILPIGLLLFLTILIAPLPASSALPPTAASPQTAPGSSAEPEIPLDQLIIKYRASALEKGAGGGTSVASAAQMQRLSDAAGVPLTYFRPMSGNAHVLRLPSPMAPAEVQAIADRLSTLSEVEYAEPDAIMQPMLAPNDPRYGDQWHYFAPGSGHYGINAPAAWDITTGAAGVVVAVIDTGITNHADLSGRTVPGYDFIASSVRANDGNGRDGDPSDTGDWVTAGQCGAFSPAKNSSWHGTHVAGTIGAASNNNVGVAGVNWNSLILPVRVLGKCGGASSDIIDGMSWAAGLSVPGAPANAHPAKVLNLSLGGPGACGSTSQGAINAIVGAGATVIISAGNSDADAVDFQPGNCAGVITVAATNRDGARAYYSNFGTTVEISAPGGETNNTTSDGVLSTLNTGTQGPAGDTYTYYQGTSMAAPHVAGVASLLYSRNPALTPAQILSILQSTVTLFPGGSTCNTSNCGSGIVNAGAAVAAVGPVTPTATPTITRTPTKTTTPTRTPTPRPFTPTAFIRLPLILRNFPPLPLAPALNAIANADGDGNYTVSWNASAQSTSYLLQEDDNAAFTSPETRYAGSGLSWNATGKAMGTYYYRVRGQNAWGAGGWSNTQPTFVTPPLPIQLLPVADTTVIEGAPTSNFGSVVDMWVGYYHCSASSNGITRSLIRFDTSAIPGGVQIASARLYIFLGSSCDMSNRTHTVTSHRIGAGWTEMGATWNNQPGYTGDYGSMVIPSQTWGWYSLDITSLAQGWVNGSYPNYGVMLRANESSGNDSAQLGFMTRETSNTNIRPYLSLLFTGMATAGQSDRPPARETPTACDDTIAQRLDTGTETTFGAFRMAHACER